MHVAKTKSAQIISMVVKIKLKYGRDLEHCKDNDHVHDIDNECKDEEGWWQKENSSMVEILNTIANLIIIEKMNKFELLQLRQRK